MTAVTFFIDINELHKNLKVRYLKDSTEYGNETSERTNEQINISRLFDLLSLLVISY